jgi:hypothetical protein
VDLQQWITDELADVRSRLADQVLAMVPPERRSEKPGGGNSIGWAVFHVARHADLAVRGVLRHDEPLLASWRDRLGAGGLPAGSGLAEAEDPAAGGLDQAAVAAYLDDVIVDAAAWAGRVRDNDLSRPADAATALVAAGVPEEAYGWLYRMWAGQPASFFLRWEAIGHAVNHLGEMVATRNRMGLSPF